MVALIKHDGQPVEWVKYSSYGEPTVYPLADFNRDGIVNSTDETAFNAEFGATGSAGALTADLDFSGTVDTDDFDRFAESFAEFTGKSGVGVQSHIGNRLGYAGYQWDHAARMYHVRHRVYRPDLGRWMTRDPLGYVDGASVYEYVSSTPSTRLDPLGLRLASLEQAQGQPGGPSAVPAPAPPTFTKPSKDDCEKAIEFIKKTSAYKNLPQGCNVSFSCDGNCSGTEDAYRDGQPGQGGTIVICINNIRDARFLPDALRHELQHAADSCNEINIGQTCADLACSEIRAVNMSGQCCVGRPYRTFPPSGIGCDSYKECVSNYAKDSVRGRKMGSDVCSVDDVNDALDRGCFNSSDAPASCTMNKPPPSRPPVRYKRKQG